MSAIKIAACTEPPLTSDVVPADVDVDAEAEAEADVGGGGGGTVTVCVTVAVDGAGVGVVGAAVVGVTLGLGVGVTLGLGVGEGDAEADGLGDAAAAVTGSQDWLPACVASGVATAAVAPPAETANRPQETEASKTPVADQVTTVRRVRVKRI